MLPVNVFAEDTVSADKNSESTTQEEVTYIDKVLQKTKVNTVTRTCSDYTKLSSYANPLKMLTLGDGWYVLDEDTTCAFPVIINGDAHLILAGNHTLNAKWGIWIYEGHTLTVYGSSENSGHLL